MSGLRSVGSALWVVGLMSAACQPEPPAPTPEPEPAPAVLDRGGDWKDTGRYDVCSVDQTSADCGAYTTFSRAGCDVGSFKSLPAEGIYTVVLRGDYATPAIGASVFRLSADARLDWYRGSEPTKRQGDEAGLFLTRTVHPSETLTYRYALLGCHTQGRQVTGCYITCRNNKAYSWGTFLAQRWEQRAGEREASGIRLLSETFVEQGLPADIYVAQGHAYVVSLSTEHEQGGLSVFDVKDPAHPVLRKTFTLPTDNYWNGVWSKGNALYVASADTGLMVFDISTPAAPVLLRSLPSGRGQIDVHTVFVEGDRLYAMSTGPTPETFIYDIRQPTEPVLLGEYLERGTPAQPVTGFPHDALAFENRLYINHWSDGYLIVDVSDAANPRKLGGFKYPFATSHANAVGRIGGRLIAFEGGENWGAHLRVLDVTDPAQPVLVGEYKLDEHISTHNMVLKGTRLYLAHYQNGVRVLDVSVPEKPREMAYYNTFRTSDPGRGQSFYDGAIGIRVPGDGYVYVIDTSRGLLIFPEP